MGISECVSVAIINYKGNIVNTHPGLKGLQYLGTLVAKGPNIGSLL